jgi:hypothetical protein
MVRHRLTSSEKYEAATDHRPIDKSFAASPNTEVGHHREPPGRRGADHPPATTFLLTDDIIYYHTLTWIRRKKYQNSLYK